MRNLLLFIFNLNFLTALSQNYPPAVDTLYKEFENCIIKFTLDSYKEASNIALFYGNNYYPYLIEDYQVVGMFYSLKVFYPKDSIFKIDTGIYREMPYNRYINFILSHVNNDSCIIGLNDGVWLYLNCPVELWLHYYLDFVIGSKDVQVTPILDIIIVKGNKVTIERKLLVCQYISGKGFEINKTLTLKEQIIICQ